MKLKILFFLFFSQVFISAQIDTTVYFPLQVGNYWEYVDNNPISLGREAISIISDTLMPNGKRYYVFDKYFVQNQKYLRLENDNLVYGYYTESCQNNEDLIYKFSVTDSTIWPACLGFSGDDGVSYYGISKTDNSYFFIFDKTLETKKYEYVRTDTVHNYPDNVNSPGDTLWDGRIWDYITKGIGKTRFKIDQGGDWILVGAIINGIEYGTITDIKNENQLPDNYQLFQNYPNPFNPETAISFQLSALSFVTLKIFDVLGREVGTLVNEEKPAGTYKINFNANNLPSGVYFYTITAGSFHQTKKMVLLR